MKDKIKYLIALFLFLCGCSTLDEEIWTETYYKKAKPCLDTERQVKILQLFQHDLEVSIIEQSEFNVEKQLKYLKSEFRKNAYHCRYNVRLIEELEGLFFYTGHYKQFNNDAYNFSIGAIKAISKSQFQLKLLKEKVKAKIRADKKRRKAIQKNMEKKIKKSWQILI